MSEPANPEFDPGGSAAPPASSGRRRRTLGIRARLTLWFVAGALGAVVIGAIVVYVAGAASIQGTLGQTYCQIASRSVGELEGRIAAQVGYVRTLATDVLTTEVAMEVDQLYANRSQAWIGALHNRLSNDWLSADSDEERREQLNPELSNRLKILAGLRSAIIHRLAVYDRAGVLLGDSTTPRERVVTTASWFVKVSTKRDHFVYLDNDRAAQTMTVVVPVWGGVEIVGFALADIGYQAWIEEVRDIRFGNTGEAVLVDYAGVPLDGTVRLFLIQALAQKPPTPARAALGDRRSPYWVALPSAGGWPLWQRLACVAPLTEINELRRFLDLPPWSLVVTQSPQESYAALSRSLGWLGVAGVLGIIVVGVGGGLLAWHIAGPIQKLSTEVRRFAGGDRDWEVTVEGNDEIGDLAHEFSDMARRVTDSENELNAYREELEQEVEARTREIADTQGLAAMGRMASMIAHDLRNALSTIKMNLQILSRRHDSADDADHEHLHMGLGQVRYMEEIMRDMLSFARPERLRADWHELARIIDEAVTALAHVAADKDIDIVVEGGGGIPLVHCDRVKVTEVLRNLIDNAIQSTPAGGEITISSYLVMDSEEPAVQISVADTGRGIDGEQMAEIFEPFFTTRAKGTGLGLAIVKRIVEQHGGEIAVETGPPPENDDEGGRGAVFSFTLSTSPVSDDGAKRPARPGPD